MVKITFFDPHNFQLVIINYFLLLTLSLGSLFAMPTDGRAIGRRGPKAQTSAEKLQLLNQSNV